MGRPRQVSDEQILAETRRCALELGGGVPLEVIAARLGVTAPALVRRFKTRHALLIHALTPAGPPPWVEASAAGPDARPLEPQLQELLEGISSFMTELVPCMAALREAGIDHTDVCRERGQLGGPARGIRAVSSWLERAAALGLVRCDDTPAAATAVMGSMMARLTLGHLYGLRWSRREQRSYVASVARLFARALAPEANTARTPKGAPP